MKIKEYIDKKINEEVSKRLNEKSKDKDEETDDLDIEIKKEDKNELELNPLKYQNNVYQLYMLLKNYNTKMNLDLISAKYLLATIDSLVSKVNKKGVFTKAKMNLINTKINQII